MPFNRLRTCPPDPPPIGEVNTDGVGPGRLARAASLCPKMAAAMQSNASEHRRLTRFEI